LQVKGSKAVFEEGVITPILGVVCMVVHPVEVEVAFASHGTQGA
jgi:hypothetical protein